MTNYTRFPEWRCKSGFTIKFNASQYSWADDTKSQRKYLRESDYITGSEKILIGKIDVWKNQDEFRLFYEEDTYKKEIDNFIQKHELADMVCPICKSKLKIKFGKNCLFYGCSNYPKYKHTLPLQFER